MKNDIKKIGDTILTHVRSAIRKAAKGDTDFEFKLNRWVFARLLQDTQKQSRPIKKKLWDSGMRSCQICKKRFSTIKGVEIHRKNFSLGYSVKNCELLCKRCHQSLHSWPRTWRGLGKFLKGKHLPFEEEVILIRKSDEHK